MQGSLVGATGWVKKRPVTKQLKNGETVLLLDLEDENSARLRLICSASAKDRYSCHLNPHGTNAAHQSCVCHMQQCAKILQICTVVSVAGWCVVA